MAKARRVLDGLAEVSSESSKPGGSITLDEAFRELEERERREAANGNAEAPPKSARRRR